MLPSAFLDLIFRSACSQYTPVLRPQNNIASAGL